MVIKVGVNGFGRIGRIIFRTCFPKSNIEISAINDPAVDIEYISYLMKFDSTHGKFNQDIAYSEDEIIINGEKIKVFREKLPSSIPWQTLGVQYVVEASGMFTTLEKASGHLASASVKRVIVTAPSVDIPMMILGVNEEQITKEHKVISCASSTLYCLAPMIKVLEDSYGVAEGFVTSIHAMTPSLKPLDGLCLRGRHWRDHRSINQNIIPAVTGACKALGKIIPQVKDKLCGLAFRVPVINVSVLDITIRLNKNTTLKEIAERIEKERTIKKRNIIKTSYDEAVSSDFKNDENSCILDVTSSLQLTPRSLKLVCWYENEYSYACRVVDTIVFCEEQCKQYILPIQGNICNDSKYTKISEKDENILRKINFENNLRMFNSISQGSGFKEKSNRKIGKEGFHSSHFGKKRFSSLNNNHNTINDKYDSIKICEPGVEFHCITGKIGRLAQVRKELAEITNKTDNLLKQSNHETLQKDNLNEWTIEKSKTNNNVMNTSKNNQVIISNNKNKIFETNSLIICDEATAPLEAHNAIDLLTIVDHLVNKIDSKLLITDNENLEDDIISKTKARKENDSPKKSSTDEAMNKVNLQGKSGIDEDSTTIRDALLNNIMGNAIATTTLNENIKRTEEYIATANNSKIISNESINVIDNKICNKSILNINQSAASIVITASSSSDKHNSNTTKKVITKRIVSSFIKKISKENNLPYGETSKAYNVNLEEKRKNDLFDKLESDTDSDDSFQVYETKSQVLDITDLSSSADDLARLDKICKIIEISDDLSDQLFSALSLTKTSKGKKWSFKDLCEKIKLDDFCNKVFGQSI